MYSCTPLFTSALDGVGGQHHAPAALSPGKVWAIGPFWTDAKNLAHTRIQPSESPARSKSLYRRKIKALQQIESWENICQSYLFSRLTP
jgi:hypothetical protein